MRRRSIAATLFWLSASWLAAALLATGVLLSELYSRALDRSLVENLQFQLETLVGAAITQQSPDDPDIAAADPRFERPASGWYWEIESDGGEVLNLSPSLIGTVLPEISGGFSPDNIRVSEATDAFGIRLRVVERRITISGQTILVTVTGNLDEIAVLVGSFRGQTLIVLGAVGLMLAGMSAIVARVAMRPIGRLRKAVEQVREGDTERVEGTFPTEIAPLAEEINELLRSNTQIIERARNQVGNLAHGLKTPLAVLRNEAETSRAALAPVVVAETDKMAGLVSSYLDRARIAARTSVIGKRADVGAVLTRLVRVMAKLNRGCTVTLAPVPDDLPWFRGEAGDLEEMAGNLLDNACKFAAGRVEVSLRAEGSGAARRVVVAVADDGPGLGPDEVARVLRRGVRLDEKKPGSGLGLDIVKELVDVYGGELSLGAAPLGGVLAELHLPAARPGGAGAGTQQ